MLKKYNLEFILNTKSASCENLKNALIEFGKVEEIQALDEGNFKIRVLAEDPALIFDTCAEFGRLKSVKIDEGAE